MTIQIIFMDSQKNVLNVKRACHTAINNLTSQNAFRDISNVHANTPLLSPALNILFNQS